MRPRVFRSRPTPEDRAVPMTDGEGITTPQQARNALARAKAERAVEDDRRKLAEERRRPGASGHHWSFTAPPSDAKPYFS